MSMRKGLCKKWLVFVLFLTAGIDKVFTVELFGFTIKPFHIVAFIVFLVWVAELLYEQVHVKSNVLKKFLENKMAVPSILLLLSYVVSSFAAMNKLRAFAYTAWLMLMIFGVFFPLLWWAREMRNLYVKYALIATFLHALYGITRTIFFHLFKIVLPGDINMFGVFFRANSLAFEPGYFTHLLMLGLPFSCVVALKDFFFSQRFKPQVLYLLHFSALTLAIFLSFARGGWLAFLVCVISSIFYLSRLNKVNFKRVKLALFCVSVLVVALMTLPSSRLFLKKLWFRMYTYTLCQYKYGSPRMFDVASAFVMFLRHPFFGVGPGNYGVRWVKDGLVEFSALSPSVDITPNNLYVEILALNGVFGFMSFGIFLYYLLNLDEPDTYFKNLDWILFAVRMTVICMGIQYLFHSVLTRSYTWLAFSLLGAYNQYLRRRSEDHVSSNF